MDRAMTDTRGIDLGSIRKVSMGYLVKYKRDPKGGISTSNTDKNDRGFNNLTTGRMLAPYNRINEFDEDPDRYVNVPPLLDW